MEPIELFCDLTNYVNRYGSWTWYECVLTAINLGMLLRKLKRFSAEAQKFNYAA